MIITEIQYFFSKIIRFQAIFKDTVEFTCALEFKISSQRILNLDKQSGNGFMSCILCQQTLRGELGSQEERGKTLPSRVGKELEQE